MPAPSGDPIEELARRADAVAARFDAAIAALHSCEGGGLCAACQEYDERLLEIEARERARERTQ